MKKNIISLVFCVMLAVLSHQASAETNRRAALDNLADSAYMHERYSEAIDLYNASIDSFGVSPRIYFNLGNAYYRNGDLGHAIISYERALRLDPSDTDAELNLRFVMSKIEDRPEDDSSFLYNMHHSIMSWMSPNAWAWTAFCLFVSMLGMIAVYMFSKNIIVRKTGFFGGMVVLVLFIYTLVISIETKSHASDNTEAVVIKPSTNLNSVPRTPKGKEDKIVPLHEGTKVEILDSALTPQDPKVGKWYEVKINNSTRAWIDASAVEKI